LKNANIVYEVDCGNSPKKRIVTRHFYCLSGHSTDSTNRNR